MPLHTMTHEVNPAEALRKKLGKLPVETQGYHVLVATYVRPERTASGLYVPDRTRAEDQWQGKVALVLQMGPDAYADKERFPRGPRCKVGDWIIHKYNEGTPFGIDDHPCRFLPDDRIVAVLPDGPDRVM